MNWNKLGIGVIGILGVIALVVVYWFPPTEYAFYPQCVFHDLTGLYCPGCGGFRAWHHLLHGRFLEALHMNALAVTLLPGLVIWLVLQRCVARRSDFWTLRASPLVQVLLAILVLAFGFLRNIPWGPLKWLAP